MENSNLLPFSCLYLKVKIISIIYYKVFIYNSLFTTATFQQNLYVGTFRKVSNSRPNHCFLLFAANISLTLYFHKNVVFLPSSVRRLIIALACEESSEDLSFKNGLLQIDKDVKKKNPSSINI